jgi:hypothetical protein
MPLTRSFLVALSLTALVPIIDAAPVDAQTATCRPWCRERSGGGTNCGFFSFEQCMWASQGADVCLPNGACRPQSLQGGPQSYGGQSEPRRR